MALTLRQAADAFRRYEAAVPRVILRRLTLIGNEAQRRAVVFHMQGLGKGFSGKPPNAPPGPIGIRTGNLRRSIKIVKASREGETSYSVGLTSDSPYAGIHEYGGEMKPHWINAKPGGVLAWQIGTRLKTRKGKLFQFIGDGGQVKVSAIKGKSGRIMAFATRVFFPGATMPARPFLSPALEEAAVTGLQGLEADLKALEQQVLGG